LVTVAGQLPEVLLRARPANLHCGFDVQKRPTHRGNHSSCHAAQRMSHVSSTRQQCEGIQRDRLLECFRCVWFNVRDWIGWGDTVPSIIWNHAATKKLLRCLPHPYVTII
jgi:hypothetical protein